MPLPTARPKRSNKLLAATFIFLASLSGVAAWVVWETLEEGDLNIPGLSSANKTTAQEGQPPARLPLQNKTQTQLEPALGALTLGGKNATNATTPATATATPAPAPSAGAALSSQEPTSLHSGLSPQPSATPLPPRSSDSYIQALSTQEASSLSRQQAEASAPSAWAGHASTQERQGKFLQDSVVLPDFVEDLAAFLVQNYWPRGSHPSAVDQGISSVGIKWLNMRYGTELTGLSWSGSDPMKNRTAILRYVMQPAMIDGLYTAYAGLFVQRMAQLAATHRVSVEGKERPLSGSEQKELFSLYASQARGLADILRNFSARTDSRNLVEAFISAESAVDVANGIYTDSMAEYEHAKDGKSGQQKALYAAMQRHALAYQKSIQLREMHRQNLSQAMGSTLNEHTRVYTALWAYRRGSEALPALQAAATALHNIGQRLQTLSPQR